MANESSAPAALVPRRLSLRQVEELAEWPYDEQPFYIDQVHRSLRNDVPQLMTQRVCVTWGYDDPTLPSGDQLVGFGVIHMSTNYFEVADRKQHVYIPLLSVKPKIESKGYGGSIVSHLILEAEKTVRHENKHEQKVSEQLFLDVYAKNERAIARYKKSGFRIINEANPLYDEREENAPYFVMARSLDCR
jgi:ribosomal protein S18 acetylase RimI-like enzyme